jgi:hypothetical protein
MKVSKELIIEKLDTIETASEDMFSEQIGDLRDELARDISDDISGMLGDTIEATLDSYYFETRSVKDKLAEVRAMVKELQEQQVGIQITSGIQDFREAVMLIVNLLAKVMKVENYEIINHYEKSNG